MDLQKAFIQVPQKLAFTKMSMHEITGNLLVWQRNWLGVRQFKLVGQSKCQHCDPNTKLFTTINLNEGKEPQIKVYEIWWHNTINEKRKTQNELENQVTGQNYIGWY